MPMWFVLGSQSSCNLTVPGSTTRSNAAVASPAVLVAVYSSLNVPGSAGVPARVRVAAVYLRPSGTPASVIVGAGSPSDLGSTVS